MTRDEIRASEIEWQQARKDTDRMAPMAGLFGLLFVSLLCIPAALLADALAAGLAQSLLTALFLAVLFAPILVTIVAVYRKVLSRSDVAMGKLEHQLKESVQSSEYESRLANALEMAEGEPEVLEVVERAFAATVPASPTELLLADNSHAHLMRMATWSPAGDPPNCGVDSPDHCPAARRAQVQRFSDSEALDACPKLRSRAQGRCSAVCVPVSIMGRTVGVIHATGEPNSSFEEGAVEDLERLAKLAGARIGLLRVMTETQLQASTDSLTGLLNRRSLESRVHGLRRNSATFTVAMADLDQFKQLNDVHGHETGDRALRLFAQTLRASLRSNDIVSRQGGEEFAIVLPSCPVPEARVALDSVRTHLLDAIRASGLPAFTVSFGIVEADDDEDLTEMLARADAALLEAKRSGRDRIVVHDRFGADLEVAPERPATNGNGARSAAAGADRANRQPSKTLVGVPVPTVSDA